VSVFEVSAAKPLVSIVIVNFNGAQVLRDCLTSVYAQSYRPIEVIVVDNASVDGSVEIVRSEFPDARLVINSKNEGFAGGSNRGVSVATGEYIALLNNDAVVDKSWLATLFGTLQGSTACILASKVITDGVPYAFYEMNGTLNYLGYNIPRKFSDLSKIFYASGASLLYRRLGNEYPFLDEFFLYHEDVFFCWRHRLRGGSVSMLQESVVHHRGSVSTKRQSTSFITFYQERNRLLNCLLLYERTTLVALLPYIVLDMLGKILLSVLGRRKSLKGIMRGYVWIAAHIAWLREERGKIQAERTVPDKEIMRLMTADVVGSNSSLAGFVNQLSRTYARIAGLSYHV